MPVVLRQCKQQAGMQVVSIGAGAQSGEVERGAPESGIRTIGADRTTGGKDSRVAIPPTAQEPAGAEVVPGAGEMELPAALRLDLAKPSKAAA